MKWPRSARGRGRRSPSGRPDRARGPGGGPPGGAPGQCGGGRLRRGAGARGQASPAGDGQRGLHAAPRLRRARRARDHVRHDLRPDARLRERQADQRREPRGAGLGSRMLDHQVLVFIGIAALLTITPGADTFLVIKNVLRGWRQAGVVTTLGIRFALFVHAILSALGLSIVLMHSANAYLALKWAGALYLTWLWFGSPRGAIRRR